MTDNILPENTNEKQNWIPVTTSILVGLLALGAFSLSYDALKGMAIDAGISDWKANVWPLLFDFALIVFSLNIVRNEQIREKVKWSWGLVIFFTLATITFNVLHSVNISESAQGWLTPVMAAIPPIAFVLAFETLMSQLRQYVNRNNRLKNIEELGIIADRLQIRVKKLASELGELTSQLKTYQSAISLLRQEISQGETFKTELAAEVNRLQQDSESLKIEYESAKQLIDSVSGKRDEAAKLSDHLGKLQSEIEKAESRLSELSQQEGEMFTANHLKTAYLLGKNPDLKGREVGEELNVSVAWGNQLKREVKPALNGEWEKEYG